MMRTVEETGATFVIFIPLTSLLRLSGQAGAPRIHLLDSTSDAGRLISFQAPVIGLFFGDSKQANAMVIGIGSSPLLAMRMAASA